MFFGAQKTLAPRNKEPVRSLSSVPFSSNELVEKQTYFTMIFFPLGSSVPCTRTRLPSNFATSV
jgi:hypothetical protein